MKLDSVYKIVDEGVAKSKIKGIDFVAYHGGVEPDMIPAKDRPLYLTDSYELALKFARREIWDDGLYEGEIPTVFTFKGHFNNPYYMTHQEYDDEGQDSNIDYKKWVKMGVDGIVLLPEDEWETTYYIVIDLSTIKLTDKKVFDDEAILDESIIHAKSSGDKLTNVVLKNPTRKELEENGIEKARCIEDSEGNWYFADMFDTLHFQIENLLRDNVGFPYFDGNDSYGISYYDVEGNEFWYNSNELMPKNKCLEQYKKSDYLRKTFPNAYLRENPYGINSEDYENEDIDLDESVKYLNKDYCDTVIITSSYEMEQYMNTHKPIRVVYDNVNDWYLVNDANKAIHSHILDDAISAGLYNEEGIKCGNDLMYTERYVQFPLFNVSDIYSEDYALDGYVYAYLYDNYIIYDRYGELKETPLYKVLGKPNDIICMDGSDENEELDEAVIPEQVPEKLYHATFSKLLRKIKRCGYLGNSPYKLWSDSNNKYVYLATDPDEAYSYAETALDDCDNERLYDMLEDDDIVILEINTKYLDKNKLFRDENVVNGETTYQYEGIINCQIMKIYKPTLDESIVYGEMNDDEMMVILHNPTRKELKDNNLDDECRIIRDGNGGYYFSSSEWTHEQIENKLKSKNLPYEETMGEFYYYQDNLFATRDDWNTDKEYNEYKQDWYKILKSSSYIVKNFGNFNVEIFGNEKLRESVFWKGEKINNYEQGYYPYENNDYDKDDEMIVWKNPSAEWIKYQMSAGKYFRFCYISETDELYIWYGDEGFHRDTMDITGVDGDVVGTMTEGGIDYWPDDDDSPALGDRLFREKRAKFLDTIYPNGYETGVQY